MNFKSFLMGSAAVLVCVSAANAADAVLVEPEPVEYIRICDVYGEGFFFIPGTETCLKFSGYVQVDYQSRSYHDGWSTSPNTHRHSWHYEANLTIEAQNETEWGTLRSSLSFTGGNEMEESTDDVFSDGNAGFHGSGDASLAIDEALISLAGFQLGYGADYWQSISDDGYYQAINDGIYGEGSATFFEYTFASDGFTLTTGLQASGGSEDGVNVSTTGLAGQPDLYVGATYSGDWGRVYGTYYQDSSVSSGAWKAGFEFDLSSAIPGGGFKGWYMSDNGDTDYVHGHAWGVSAQLELAENLSLYAGYSDYDWSEAGTVWTAANDLSATDMSVGVTWAVAAGLEVQAEYNKRNYDFQVIDDRPSVGSINIRVVRSF